MSLKNAGIWLVTAAVGAMLAAAPTTALAARTNVGTNDFNKHAVPATFQTTNNSEMSKYKKIDDDDYDGGDWDFGYGYGVGPWWGGWYATPYWGWNPYYYYYPAPQYRPKKGQVKIETPRKNAKVYINGGYAGRVKHAHKFELKPGQYSIRIQAANGQTYATKVFVSRGRTVRVRPDFRAEHKSSS